MLKKWIEYHRHLVKFLIWMIVVTSYFAIKNYCSDGLVVGLNQPIVHDDLNFRVMNVSETPDPQGRRHFVVKLQITSQAKRATFASDLSVIHCFDRNRKHLAAPSHLYLLNDPDTTVEKLAFAPGTSDQLTCEYLLPADSADPRIRVSAGSGVTEHLDLLLEGRKQIRISGQ